MNIGDLVKVDHIEGIGILMDILWRDDIDEAVALIQYPVGEPKLAHCEDIEVINAERI